MDIWKNMSIPKFLFQKFDYNVKEIKTGTDARNMVIEADNQKIEFFCYDTETTGLNVMKDKPFLIIFGFNKNIYYWEADNNYATERMYELIKKHGKYLFAHNAKFDYHMMINNGMKIPDDIKVADEITMIRLTETADDQYYSMKLSKLGEKYVDESAKFAATLIDKELQKMRALRKKKVVDNYKLITGNKKFTDAWDEYTNRIRFVTKYHEVFDEYIEPTYYDIYIKNKELVVNYAIDDVVIMLESLPKMINIYCQKYNKEGVVNNEVFYRESKLVSAIAEIERQGFVINVDYLINSHYKIVEYQKKLYDELHKLTNDTWKVGQHKKIKDWLNDKYNLQLDKCDKKVIKNLTRSSNDDVKKIAKIIKKLRTVDKWLSTYIDGILNKIIEVNGVWKLFTLINNNGAVSGRVSSDLQQMPTSGIDENDSDDHESVLDNYLMDDSNTELFNPRSMILPSKDYVLYFEDFSQLELRLQALYTIIIGKPDLNLCRAYMPFKCYRVNGFVREEFDYKNYEHIKDWNLKRNGDSLWYHDENNVPWIPTDLHSKTALAAFPNITKDQPDFKKYRGLGKSTNFGSIYGVGINGLMDMLDTDEQTARNLLNGFRKTFPNVKDYQNYVNNELSLKGYVENLYGRRYYITDSKNYYKASNYLIQGSGADMLKEIELKIIDYLKDKKSRFIIPIHDEVVLEIHKDEEEFVPYEIKKIMEDIKDKIPYIPIICEISKTTTNWAEKKDVK